jgi:hypothetical protein
VPAGQPESVHQIAERLFPAYTFDGGRMHLAGCKLEDRLFLRLRFGTGEGAVEVYLDADGRPVPREQIDSLHLAEPVPLEEPRPVDPALLVRLVALGSEEATSLDDARADHEPDVLVIWGKHTEGKIRFTAGEESADLAFAGWTTLLAPPPFVCPRSGRETFRLALTDDGRIAAAEAVEACQETGRRMLADELATCSATGRRAAAELLETCPVSGEPVLRREMIPCRTCAERVSPAVIDDGACAACRGLEPVDTSDGRLAGLLEKHPGLADWPKWRMAETRTALIFVASGWVRRMVVVADKESLEVKRVATGRRLASGWAEVPAERHGEVLG